MPQIRTRTGCESCRRRHTKCDNKQPSCLSCKNLQIRCQRQESLTFRHMTSIDPARSPDSAYEFSTDQYWTKVPKKLSFVHSVPANESVLEPEFGLSPRGDAPIVREVTSIEEPAVDTNTSVQEEGEYVDFSPHQEDVTDSSTSQQGIPLRLPTIEEATLYRHFLTNMSSWFDINDWSRTCTRELIRRSSSSHLLRGAIYAMSSRHLANLQQFESDKADRYHDDCMEELIPSLTDSAVLVDDNMFATTVILRTKEEMEAYLVDPEIYLLGVKAFTDSEHFEQHLSPFREAIYWVALRQEIHSVLIRQRPLGINLNVSFMKHLTDLSTDTSWTKACVLNLAKIVMFCFDDERKTNDGFDHLWAFTERLSHTLPHEYQPMFYSTAATERTHPFPQVWLLSDTAVHSVQYLTFSKILLSCFNPTIPRVGIGSHSSARRNQENIIQYLRYLCGIGLSHPEFGPGMFLTCLAIALSGDGITARDERDCCLDILNQTQKKHGWQCHTIKRGLLESWTDMGSPSGSPGTCRATSSVT